MAKVYQADYLRLSMEDGDVVSNGDKVESDSIAHQRELISRYRSEKELYPGMEVLEFVDDGYSGTNFERPAVKQMLSLIREGKICCVIVKDLSRFGRNYLEVSDYLEQIFPFMGVRFIAINDGYDSDDYIGTTGGIELALKNLLYDMYSKDLSAKMCSALEIRRKRGDFIGPRPPFGYRFSKNKKVLEIDPAAAQHVKRVFELACMGHSTGEIAKRLNAEKIPTPGRYKNQEKMQYHMLDGEGCWNSKGVRNILENRVYLGIVVNGKSKATKIGGKQFKRVADEEQICVPGKHEAIISLDDFEKAAKAIQYRGNQKGKTHHPGNESILKGKLRCGNCKRSLVRISCTTVPCFACERPNYDESCGCFRGKVTEPELEAFVWEQIRKRMEENGQNDDSRKQSEEKDKDLTRSLSSANEQLKMMEHRKASLKTEKQYLYEQFKQRKIDRTAYSRRMEILRTEENELRERISRLSGAGMEPAAKCAEEGRGEMKNTEGISRELAEQYIDTIYVFGKEQFEIVWRK